MIQWLSGAPRWMRSLMFLWVRFEKPVKPPAIDPEKPVIYVTEYPSLSDRLVIDQLAKTHKLPRAYKPSPKLPNKLPFLSLRWRPHPFASARAGIAPRLRELLEYLEANPEEDIQLVPVSVMWGRRPNKQKSLFGALLSDAWTAMGPIRKLITITFNGRHTYAEINEPISLRSLLAEQNDTERLARKVNRVLRVHFRRVRTAIIGPDLSHRRMLINSLMQSNNVRQAIEQQAKTAKGGKEGAQKQARKYFEEIAANLSYPTVRMLDVLLTWLWNKIYDGVTVNNVEQVKEVAQDSTLVYVPCHRSHIDYLLVSYSLYYNGLSLPHIAAGVNLNMPVVGSILRRAGAFYIRRSFRGDKLYTAVFNEYMHAMFARGFAIEYYVEGGRSRTGRTLDPKAGTINMTMKSFLRDPSRPIKFVPIYIGYEKLFEGNSYLSELRGKQKQKESIWGLLKTIRRLRNYGRVAMNFGEPIDLAQFLNQQAPQWQDETWQEDSKPEWFTGAVDQLAKTVVTRINQAADINPINLLATSMLTTPRQAMAESELLRQMQLLADLQRDLPFSEYVSLPEGEARDWLAYGISQGVIFKHQQTLGTVWQIVPEQAVLQTYYRNNTLHLFALPSLLACIFAKGAKLNDERVQKRIATLYPYVKAELFLPWQDDEVAQRTQHWLDQLVAHGLLQCHDGEYEMADELSEQHRSLWHLAQLMMPTLERYYLTLSVLSKSGSGQLSAGELEQLAQQMAERLSLLNGIHSPEFFDRALFKKFIQGLRNGGILTTNEAGKLAFDERVEEMLTSANQVLRRSVRQTIRQVAALSEPTDVHIQD